MYQKFIGIFLILTLSSCSSYNQQATNIHHVTAKFTTPPSKDGEDHMDDPAIYVNKKHPAKSFIIATYKSRTDGGLFVYDLEGNEIQFLADGSMNNVDIRYGFKLGKEMIDIAVATHRYHNTLAIYKIDPATKHLINVTAKGFSFEYQPYGGCLYHNPKTDKFYFFATSPDGIVQQVELYDNGNQKIATRIVRTLNLGSRCEGCVVDDENGILFVGEEDVALWKYNAEPSSGEAREKIDGIGTHLVADIEGLTLYQSPGGKGYLIASSQGNSTYVVYDRQPPHLYRGTFDISDTAGIEGTEQTDGIAVTSQPIPPHFPNGLFVAHDNRSRKGGASNFKYVSWKDVAQGLNTSELE